MKNTIILFDIDETLFDPEKYLTTVFSHAAKLTTIPEKKFTEKCWELFQKFREKNPFTPDAFAKFLATSFTLSLSDVSAIFWDKHIFTDALYDDVIPTLTKLEKDCYLGILSTGEEAFQQAKIAKIVHVLDKNALHIFAAKEKELQNVLQRYKDKKIYFVDDKEEILRLAKNIHPEIQTILIARKAQKRKESITSLIQLISLVK